MTASTSASIKLSRRASPPRLNHDLHAIDANAPDSLIDLRTGVDTDGWAFQNFHVGGSDAVVATFKRYGVFDDKVVIAAGLFNETLPILPTEQIALLRMDCDMYRSTIDALSNLYDKVAVLWQCINQIFAARPSLRSIQ